MTTDKQIEANRRNAQLSTGPKTPEGKSRSRLNAFKHGMNATGFVIPSGQAQENLEEFQGLLAALRHDLQPQGTLQELLVESIAIQQWRLRRIYRAELAGVAQGIREHDLHIVIKQMMLREEKHDAPLPIFTPPDHIADKLLRYQRVLESSISRHLAELRRLQANAPSNPRQELPPSPQEEALP
jgi:hypothetical protein